MQSLMYDWGVMATKPELLGRLLKTYVFDLESNGLLDTMDRIHCIVIEDFNTGVTWSYTPDQIEAGIRKLEEADELVGHNIIGFDLQAIRKIYPWFKPRGIIKDTLCMARVIWSDIKSSDFGLFRKGKISAKNIGRHSLESYGERIGELKGDYGKTTDWANFTPEMLTYCQQDVRVTSKLYHKILFKAFPESVLRMEQDIHTICLDQEQFGFTFNEHKAQILLAKLLARKAELYASIFLQLGPSWIVGVEDRTSSRTVKYKDVEKGNEFAGSQWTKIKVVAFNPNSRAHLAKRLIEVFKWQPTEFGEDGLPSLDDEVLTSMGLPIAKDLQEFLMIQKRLGQLAEGEQAWMSLVDEQGRIHGRVNTMGAITARASHSKPNLAQIPSNDSPYGHECRELFTPPKGWKQFGTDASGLELRMLAHYMAAYDGGAYGKELLEGDIHTANMNAAGLASRAMAKKFIYTFLYGGGDEKVAEVFGGTKAQGKALKEKFLRNTPALKALREAVADRVEKTGCLKALDGRIIPVRHKHAALNTLLQSAGAIVCKQWCIYFHQLLREAGYVLHVDYAQLAWVHDELQIGYNPKRLTNEQLLAFSKQSMVMVTQLFKLRIPVDAAGNSGDSYAETH